MPDIEALIIKFLFIIIFSFVIKINNKKPNATIAKRKLKENKGDALVTIILVDIKAEDHKIINNKDKTLVTKIFIA
jgi:hypothetical protein